MALVHILPLHGSERIVEMKIVSVETQKKIMYIPYVNILNLFIWLNNIRYMDVPYNGVPKTLLILFINSIPLVLIQSILVNTFPIVGNVLSYINVYLIPLLISRGLIRYQEQLLASDM